MTVASVKWTLFALVSGLFLVAVGAPAAAQTVAQNPSQAETAAAAMAVRGVTVAMASS